MKFVNAVTRRSALFYRKFCQINIGKYFTILFVAALLSACSSGAGSAPDASALQERLAGIHNRLSVEGNLNGGTRPIDMETRDAINQIRVVSDKVDAGDTDKRNAVLTASQTIGAGGVINQGTDVFEARLKKDEDGSNIIIQRAAGAVGFVAAPLLELIRSSDKEVERTGSHLVPIADGDTYINYNYHLCETGQPYTCRTNFEITDDSAVGDFETGAYFASGLWSRGDDFGVFVDASPQIELPGGGEAVFAGTSSGYYFEDDEATPAGAYLGSADFTARFGVSTEISGNMQIGTAYSNAFVLNTALVSLSFSFEQATAMLSSIEVENEMETAVIASANGGTNMVIVTMTNTVTTIVHAVTNATVSCTGRCSVDGAGTSWGGIFVSVDADDRPDLFAGTYGISDVSITTQTGASERYSFLGVFTAPEVGLLDTVVLGERFPNADKPEGKDAVVLSFQSGGASGITITQGMMDIALQQDDERKGLNFAINSGAVPDSVGTLAISPALRARPNPPLSDDNFHIPNQGGLVPKGPRPINPNIADSGDFWGNGHFEVFGKTIYWDESTPRDTTCPPTGEARNCLTTSLDRRYLPRHVTTNLGDDDYYYNVFSDRDGNGIGSNDDGDKDGEYFTAGFWYSPSSGSDYNMGAFALYNGLPTLNVANITTPTLATFTGHAFGLTVNRELTTDTTKESDYYTYNAATKENDFYTYIGWRVNLTANFRGGIGFINGELTDRVQSSGVAVPESITLEMGQLESDGYYEGTASTEGGEYTNGRWGVQLYGESAEQAVGTFGFRHSDSDLVGWFQADSVTSPLDPEYVVQYGRRDKDLLTVAFRTIDIRRRFINGVTVGITDQLVESFYSRAGAPRQSLADNPSFTEITENTYTWFPVEGLSGIGSVQFNRKRGERGSRMLDVSYFNTDFMEGGLWISPLAMDTDFSDLTKVETGAFVRGKGEIYTGLPLVDSRRGVFNGVAFGLAADTSDRLGGGGIPIPNIDAHTSQASWKVALTVNFKSPGFTDFLIGGGLSDISRNVAGDHDMPESITFDNADIITRGRFDGDASGQDTSCVLACSYDGTWGGQLYGDRSAADSVVGTFYLNKEDSTQRIIGFFGADNK